MNFVNKENVCLSLLKYLYQRAQRSLAGIAHIYLDVFISPNHVIQGSRCPSLNLEQAFDGKQIML